MGTMTKKSPSDSHIVVDTYYYYMEPVPEKKHVRFSLNLTINGKVCVKEYGNITNVIAGYN